MPMEAQERNPYVGPRPFEREDKDIFFGRHHEASVLLSLMTAHRIVLLYAHSGAGKTSLINAGLIPLLDQESFEVFPPARVHGQFLQDIAPTEIRNLYVFNALMSWTKGNADPRQLAQLSFTSFLQAQTRAIDEDNLPLPRLIIFDQLEELFIFYSEPLSDREGFFHQIGEALNDDPFLRVIFVMREDYIAEVDPYTPILPEKLRTRFRLERLRREPALKAVIEPLKGTRRHFGAGVAEKLVEDLLKVRVETAAGERMEVAGEFVEPVQLQVVCQSLWRDLPAETTELTWDYLRTFGDVNQVLSDFYESAIQKVVKNSKAQENELRKWFEQKLITPAGTVETVYRGRQQTGDISNVAVDMLEDLHLIRGEWWGGARRISLSHDRLISVIRQSNANYRFKRVERYKTAFGIAVAVLIPVVSFFIALAVFAPDQSSEQAMQELVSGKLHFDAKNYERAIGDLRASLASRKFLNHAALAEASLLLARALEKLGQREQARQQYESALQVAPQNAEAHRFYGFFQLEAGDSAAAYNALSRYSELSHRPPREILTLEQFAALVRYHFSTRSASSPPRRRAFDLTVQLRQQRIRFYPMGRSPEEGFDDLGFVSYVLQQSGIIRAWPKNLSALEKQLTPTMTPELMDLIIVRGDGFEIALFYIGDFWQENLCIGVGPTAFVEIVDRLQLRGNLFTYYRIPY